MGRSWLPLGPSLEPESFINRRKVVARNTLKTLRAKCCTRGLLGPPPTLKLNVSPPRNHHLQISTCTFKTIGHCIQWVPLWHHLGSKERNTGSQKNSLTKQSKNVRKKLCRVIQVILEMSLASPGQKLPRWQEADRQGIRDTPLVPRGHGGGFDREVVPTTPCW